MENPRSRSRRVVPEVLRDLAARAGYHNIVTILDARTAQKHVAVAQLPFPCILLEALLHKSRQGFIS